MSELVLVSFTIPGPPVAKGRPRVALRHGRAVAYTPARTARFESTVALAASHAMAGRAPAAGPLEVYITAKFPIPASWPKKRRQEAADGILPHASRPDADNVSKAILDGLAGIVLVDDAQVAFLQVQKGYSDTPGTTVTVFHWEP